MKKIYTHPLRIVREQHNLTIEKLAEAAKLGAKTVWNAEHNCPVSAESRQRLCDYFHMTSLELGLTNDNNETPKKTSDVEEAVDSSKLSRRDFVAGLTVLPFTLSDEKRYSTSVSVSKETIINLENTTLYYRKLQRNGSPFTEVGLIAHIAMIQHTLECTIDDQSRRELWKVLAQAQLIARLNVTKEQELGRAKTWNELAIASAQYSGDTSLFGATVGHLAHLYMTWQHSPPIARNLIDEAQKFIKRTSALDGWFTIIIAAIESKEGNKQQCELAIAKATDTAHIMQQEAENNDAFFTDFSIEGIDSFAGNCLLNIGKPIEAFERLIHVDLEKLAENRHASIFYDIARACVSMGELNMAQVYALRSIEKALATNRLYIVPRFVTLAQTIRQKDLHSPHATIIADYAHTYLQFHYKENTP